MWDQLLLYFLAIRLSARQQLGDGDELIALRAQFVDDGGEGEVCLLGRVACVKEHDVAGMCLCQHVLDDLLGTWIKRIFGIGVPLDDDIVQLVGNFQHPVVKIAVR